MKIITQELANELYEFVKKFSEQTFCLEEPKECYQDSGPYCGRHDLFVSDEEIKEARAIIAKVSAAE